MALARVSDADRGEALSRLPATLQPPFLRMTHRDQRHALRVSRRLRAELGDGASELLLKAALLHDVGKAEAPLGIPGRSLVVLAGALRVAGRLERLPGLGTRVRRYRQHPALGAELLRQAGADPALIEIVAEHQAPAPRHPETLKLQAVDGRE